MHGLSAAESANILIQIVVLSSNKTETFIHHLNLLDGIIPDLLIVNELDFISHITFVSIKLSLQIITQLIDFALFTSVENGIWLNGIESRYVLFVYQIYVLYLTTHPDINEVHSHNLSPLFFLLILIC